MKTSELIKILQDSIEKNGDLDVWFDYEYTYSPMEAVGVVGSKEHPILLCTNSESEIKEMYTCSPEEIDDYYNKIS